MRNNTQHSARRFERFRRFQTSKFCLFCVFCLFLKSSLAASTYFVDSNGSDSNVGGKQSPWRTLQFAADKVEAGDTVIVRAGEYRGFSMHNKSGTATKRIIFKAQPGAIINQAGRLGDGINLEYSSFITIDGFQLVGNGIPFDYRTRPNGTRAGIRVVGDGRSDTGRFSTGVHILNNQIDLFGVWGIFTGFSGGLVIDNNQTMRSRQQHGIYVSNSADGPVIRNNLVCGNAASGIQLNADYATGNKALTRVDGLITQAVIEDNIIYDNGKGFEFTDSSIANARAGGAAINLDGVQNSVIKNNLLYRNYGSGLAIFGQDGKEPSRYNVFANNTIVMANKGRYAIQLSKGASHNILGNNILIHKGSRSGAMQVEDGALEGLKSNYNGLHGVLKLGSFKRFNTLTEWQRATALDTKSKQISFTNIDKLFEDIDKDNYQLSQDSVLHSSGTPNFRLSKNNDIATSTAIGAMFSAIGNHKTECGL